MTHRVVAIRVVLWLALAMLVVWPASFSPASVLVGHPDVDIWNHAWGYWFVPHQIGSFSWPFSTGLIGAPDGGDLYFIDLLGAIVGAPLAWVFGPAVAYNGVMVLRVAAAGLAGQALAESVLGRGLHGWVAGAATASMPFLLCEMSNGISEVCTVHWVAWTLWAAHRVYVERSQRAWRRLGILQGLCTVGSFYYGLVTGGLIACLVVIVLWPKVRGGWRPERSNLRLPGQAVGIAMAISLPIWLLFQWTLHSKGALIVRPEALEAGWMVTHNAVDPRTYFIPGDFQSVDLSVYGEAFRHTGYLRWSLLALALFGLIRQRDLWPWALVGFGSLVVGLGPFLFWGDWITLGGRAVSLPFFWIESVLPDIAITHPLRLCIGGQVILALLAAAGAKAIPWAWLSAPLAALTVAEGLLASPAEWPVPTASAEVPAVYAGLPEGPILDLPGSVGKTMATSQYFWFQTEHGQPIPYSPNARLDSCRDLDVQASFTDPHKRALEHAVLEDPGKGPDLIQKLLAKRYGAIVLHTDLEERADLPSAYEPVLTYVFGPPQVVGEHRVWTFSEDAK